MLMSIFSEMRPKQWTKNFFVYAAVLFNGSLFQAEKFFVTTEIFIAFCLVSSGVYFFNDIFDYESDRLNPDKCDRPIASGAISIKSAYFCAAVLSSVALILAYQVNFECFLLLLSYAVINIFYTVKLKKIVIVDVMIIAYGFVARALIGAWAAEIFLTEWFMLCVMFLSLFLALGKRRHELENTKSTGKGRKVLQSYSLSLIDQMININSAALLMSYALFTMDANTQNKSAMILTIPLVLYGIFYYLYVVQIKGKGGAPDKILYKEKPILLTVLIYVAVIIFSRNV